MTRALASLLLRGALTGNRWRLALTIACIALGVALAGAVHTIHASALAEIDRAARTLAGIADLEIRGPRSGFDDASFAPVASHPGVRAASPVVELDAALADGDGTLRILGIDAFRAVQLQPAFVPTRTATGSGNLARLLDPEALWLSPAAAGRLGKRAGDTLALVAGSAPRTFTVAGVLEGLAAGGDLAVLDIASAQARFGRLGRLSRIDISLAPDAGVDTTMAALARLLPPGVGVHRAASASGRAAAITRAYRVNLDALALVALATGAFLVFSTLALQAARRRQEFALLRAMGVTRRGLALLLATEGAAIGAAGALAGTALGLLGSRAMLGRVGADLGAGYFASDAARFAPDPLALAGIALLGVAMSATAAAWVARAVGRIPVAEALRDRAVDLPGGGRNAPAWSAALFLAGVPLLFAPPAAGLPVAGYAAIALWLAAAVVAVTPLCRAVLRRLRPRSTVGMLALAQVRDLPGHLAASIAGIVVSASLCVAMAIMVFSFRASLEDWLGGVVGADLYVRAAEQGDTTYFAPAEQQVIAALPGIERVDAVRYDRIAMGDAMLTLVARPLDRAILEGFRAAPLEWPPPDSEAPPAWISEAARDLHGWKPGDVLALPLGGRTLEVRVAGVIRDYARTWGAVLVPLDAYRSFTGDERANDLALFLAPGTDPGAVQRAIRDALPHARSLAMEDAAGIRSRSLAIFDRSFAVTYALEAIAIVIGLAGVTSSFAALAWSRRREFGVLRFLGLTRREILRMLAVEGAAAGALGSAIGLAAGTAISFVLVHVVNRQSFHWSIEVHWPGVGIAWLLAAIVATCAAGARTAAALAVRHEAVLAVKDDA